MSTNLVRDDDSRIIASLWNPLRKPALGRRAENLDESVSQIESHLFSVSSTTLFERGWIVQRALSDETSSGDSRFLSSLCWLSSTPPSFPVPRSVEADEIARSKLEEL